MKGIITQAIIIIIFTVFRLFGFSPYFYLDSQEISSSAAERRER